MRKLTLIGVLAVIVAVVWVALNSGDEEWEFDRNDYDRLEGYSP